MSIKEYIKSYDVLCKDNRTESLAHLVFNLFDDNMKLVIKWAEEDWQGVFYALYQDINTKKYYFYEGNFGSCSGCDEWLDCKYGGEHLEPKGIEDFNIFIDKLLNDFEVYDSLYEIVLNEFWHVEWKKIFQSII